MINAYNYFINLKNNFNNGIHINYYMDFDFLENLSENWKKSKDLRIEKN